MAPELCIIIPVYNEEGNLLRVQQAFEEYFAKAKIAFKVLFVNDGSKDNSLQIIREICKTNPLFSYISFKKTAA